MYISAIYLYTYLKVMKWKMDLWSKFIRKEMVMAGLVKKNFYITGIKICILTLVSIQYEINHKQIIATCTEIDL